MIIFVTSVTLLSFSLLGEEKILEEDCGVVSFPNQVYFLSDIQQILVDLKEYRVAHPHSLFLFSLKLDQQFYPYYPELTLHNLNEHEVFLDRIVVLLKFLLYLGNKKSFFSASEKKRMVYFYPLLVEGDLFFRSRFGEIGVDFFERGFQTKASPREVTPKKEISSKQNEMIQGVVHSLNKQILHSLLWK